MNADTAKWFCLFLCVAAICTATGVCIVSPHYYDGVYKAKANCFAANLGDKCFKLE